MARLGTQIYANLESKLVFYANQAGLTCAPQNWSENDYKRLLMYAVADGTATMEQVQDSFKEDIDSIRKRLPSLNRAWMRYQMLNLFQYDATDVQIVQFDEVNFNPFYSNINDNYKVIKYCSPMPGILGTALIKIAADLNGEPVQITGPALDAAQRFCTTIAPPGITYNVESKDSDKLFLQVNVSFNGLYASVIEANVVAAIKNYLKSIPFETGLFVLSDLTLAIKSVQGVIDCDFDNVQARADVTTVGTGTNLILNNLELATTWAAIAGFIIPEDTAGANWRLTDYRVGVSGIKNLNLIAQ